MLRILPVLACLALLAAAACKQTAQQVSATVKSYAEGVSTAGRATGEELGLLKPRTFDYVRRAWNAHEEPAALAGTYTFEQERELGRALAAEFQGRLGRHENDRLERYLALVAAALAAHSERPDLPAAVSILRSETVACYAAPGGYVLVTFGALRLCRSESELAGLFAQAIAYSASRRALADLEGLQAELNPAGGGDLNRLDANGFSNLLEQAANRFVARGYDYERLAACDRQAVDLLVRLGYEPGGLKAFLTRQQVQIHERSGGRPALGLDAFKGREEAIDARLAQLAAPSIGRNLVQRFRQECQARLPAPVLSP